MTDNILDQKLQGFGVSLHQSILGQLVGQIETAIASGEIRSQEGMYSVYDFIRVFSGNRNASQSWKDFVAADQIIIRLTDVVKFAGARGRSYESPATDMTGLIYIAYMGQGQFSHQLRSSSAVLLAKDFNSFNATPSGAKQKEGYVDRIAELEAALEKSVDLHEDFPVTLAMLHKSSGIVSKSQVKKAVKRDFIEDRDYIEMQDGFIYINVPTFYILMISFKALKGADISGLPAILPIATEAYFQYQKMKRMNTRVGQRDQSCPGQMPLDLI